MSRYVISCFSYCERFCFSKSIDCVVVYANMYRQVVCVGNMYEQLFASRGAAVKAMVPPLAVVVSVHFFFEHCQI